MRNVLCRNCAPMVRESDGVKRGEGGSGGGRYTWMEVLNAHCPPPAKHVHAVEPSASGSNSTKP